MRAMQRPPRGCQTPVTPGLIRLTLAWARRRAARRAAPDSLAVFLAWHGSRMDAKFAREWSSLLMTWSTAVARAGHRLPSGSSVVQRCPSRWSTLLRRLAQSLGSLALRLLVSQDIGPLLDVPSCGHEAGWVLGEHADANIARAT